MEPLTQELPLLEVVLNLPDTLTGLSLDWMAAKQAVERLFAFHQDGLHVLSGVMLHLLASLVLRRSLRDVLPWLAVLALELANEWIDLAIETWPNRTQQWGEGRHDLILTMILPTLLFLLARYAPQLLVGQAAATPPRPPE
jgi:hypothetical protein